jgi:Leucine-rich repeat (LRR) protein
MFKNTILFILAALHFNIQAQVNFDFRDGQFFKIYGSPNVEIYKSWSEALKAGGKAEKVNIKNEYIGDKFSKIEKLGNLQLLQLSETNINNIPDGIGKLTQLFVFISMNNPIKTISPQISNCRNLMYLILDGTKLDSIPPHFNSMRSLELLAINKNESDTFKIDEAMKIRSLRNLEIGSSNVYTFPESISDMSNLEKFVCLDCKISKIPQNIGLNQKLKVLDLSYNQISEIPESVFMMKNLKYLGLRDNKIKELSEKFYYLKNLEILDLRGNPVSDEQVAILKVIIPKCYIMTDKR